MTDQRYRALKGLKRFPYSGVLGCGFTHPNGTLAIIIPLQKTKQEAEDIADAIEGIPDLLAKIEALTEEVERLNQCKDRALEAPK